MNSSEVSKSKPGIVKFIFVYFFAMGLIYIFTLLMTAVLFQKNMQPNLKPFWIVVSSIELGLVGILALIASFEFRKGRKWTRYAFYVLAVLFIFNTLVGNIAFFKAGKSLPDPISIAQIIGAVWVLFNLHKQSVIEWCRN